MPNLTPAQYVALRAEIKTDPKGYGYAPYVAIGDDTGLANALNLARDGVNGGPAISLRRALINPADVLEAVDVRDFAATIAGVENIFVAAWFTAVTQAQQLQLLNEDGTENRVLANLRRMIGNANGSRDRLVAIANAPASRMEELFGRGQTVTDQDIALAMAPDRRSA